MINKRRLILNLKKMYPNALLEYSFSDLAGMTDTKRKARSVGMTAFYQGLDQAKDGHARTHWKVPSQSGKEKRTGKDNQGNYNVVVQIHVKGGLFNIARERWDASRFAKVFGSADVKIHCTCPDFYWAGMKYNTGNKGNKKGALAYNRSAGHGGGEKNIAPKIRDPHGEHTLCKHLLSVFRVFSANALKIMSQARRYDSNIKISEKAAKTLDKGKEVLEKEVELIEVEVPEYERIIVEPLEKAAEQLAKNKENEGSEDVIEKEEEEREEREVPEETEDIISEKSKEATEEPEPSEETEDIISEKSEEATEEPEPSEQIKEVLEEENIEQEPEKKLEKDKRKEESEVSSDVGELLGK